MILKAASHNPRINHEILKGRGLRHVGSILKEDSTTKQIPGHVPGHLTVDSKGFARNPGIPGKFLNAVAVLRIKRDRSSALGDRREIGHGERITREFRN